MTRLPRVSGRDVIRALERAGFVIDRSSGSHHVLVHPDDPERRTIVPFGRKTMKLGTLRNILRQARISVDDFTSLL